MHSEIAMAVVLPGWSARRRRRWFAIGLLLGGAGLPVLFALGAVLSRRNWVALTLDATFLAMVVAVGAVAIACRGAALAEVWFRSGRRTNLSRLEALTAILAVSALAAGTVAVVEVGRARASIAPAFAGAGAEVLYDASAPPVTQSRPAPPDTTTAPSTIEPLTPIVPMGDANIPAVTLVTTTTLPPLPTRPDSGVDKSLLADVTTVLLIGGDAGPGRSGLRTDSMMLFSLHRPSGRASLISIPRDLERVLFPPGSALAGRHPYGYDGMANAIYIDVASHRNLRDAYEVEGVRPGVVALAQALGYSLDVTVDDYVLVDMQGFLELIDALGGVTLRLPKAIPMPGNVPGAPTQYPDVIGPGLVAMDGSMALGYARSRKGDNDYRRARRQRDLLAALATQVSLTDVATSFGEIASAIGGTLRTSLTPVELADTLSVIGGSTAIVESVGLVPPLISIRRPNFDQLAQIVGAVQLALVTGVASGY